jgi:hypothetical protein
MKSINKTATNNKHSKGKMLLMMALSLSFTIMAQTDSSAKKRGAVIIDCEKIYPERTLNHDPINPDYYTYDHSGDKEKCMENNAKNIKVYQTDTSTKEIILMKNNKMMVVAKGGSSVPLTETLTLGNGTKVLTNGTVIRKDGTRTMLKERDYIFMSGKVITAK